MVRLKHPGLQSVSQSITQTNNKNNKSYPVSCFVFWQWKHICFWCNHSTICTTHFAGSPHLVLPPSSKQYFWRFFSLVFDLPTNFISTFSLEGTQDKTDRDILYGPNPCSSLSNYRILKYKASSFLSLAKVLKKKLVRAQSAASVHTICP